MQRYLIAIFAFFTLATPAAHADFADWIHDRMPTSKQVSKEYRDEAIYMKNKKNISVPIVFVKANNAPYKAATCCIDCGPASFAIMYINEDAFRSSNPSDNTRTLAHEIEHVKNNDASIPALKLFAALVMSGVTLYKMYADPHDFSSVAFAIASAAITHDLPEIPTENSISLMEAKADQASFETLGLLGYHKALEDQVKENTKDSNAHGAHFRPRGEQYPTSGEHLSWAQEACANCKAINPAERPDSPNLMRNGIPR
jgi:hypothetical protein